MRIRHILLKTPLLVDQIMVSLRRGADFGTLAREHSACPSAKQGGDVGNISALELPQELQEALKDLPVNEVSKPIATHHGIHIVRLEAL